MVIVAGSGRVVPENRDQFLASFQALIKTSRSEPGCLDYVVAADPVDSGRVNVFERWESAEHLAAHLAAMNPPSGVAEQVLSMEVAQYEIGAILPMNV